VVAFAEHARRGRVVGAGEQTLPERLVDQHPAAVHRREREDPLGSGLRGEQVVPHGEHVGVDAVEQLLEPGDLVDTRPGSVQPMQGEPVRATHPDRPHEPFSPELVHRRHRAVQPAVVLTELGVVEEVQVQVVGAQVGQGLFELATHVAGVVAVRRGAGEVADLGREHQFGALHAFGGHQFPDQPLTAAVAVDVGGVEQPRTHQVRGGQCGSGRVLVHRTPAHRQPEVVVRAADRPAAHTQRGHRDPA
jgi:hypothetical protein